MKNLICHKDCAKAYRKDGKENGQPTNLTIARILKQHCIDHETIGDKIYAVEEHYTDGVWQYQKYDVTSFTYYDLLYYLGY